MEHLFASTLGSDAMFRIRVFTPQIVNAAGWPHAGAEFIAGDVRLIFRVDLRYWQVGDYERQWASGIARLRDGAPSSALMSRFVGADDSPHLMWALWREHRHVYIQSHCVISADSQIRFDPAAPYEHVGARVPVSENALPMTEWRVDLEHVLASGFGVRWSLGQ